MDAVKKLPPSRRFLKHNLPKSPAKRDVKSTSTKPGTKSTTKSPAKKSQKSKSYYFIPLFHFTFYITKLAKMSQIIRRVII